MEGKEKDPLRGGPVWGRSDPPRWSTIAWLFSRLEELVAFGHKGFLEERGAIALAKGDTELLWKNLGERKVQVYISQALHLPESRKAVLCPLLGRWNSLNIPYAPSTTLSHTCHLP